MITSTCIRLSSENRLHGLEAPIVGLTGGIATGKSTVSKLLEKEGVPVIDADRLVKDIYRLDETQELVRRRCPEAWKHGTIDFPTLRKHFFQDPVLKKELEAFLYARLPGAFKEAYAKLGSPSWVVYDVPLLFEKGLDRLVDVKVLVYAPRSIQRTRLMDRDGHPEDMANTILSNQMDIEEKKSKVDFVIDNSRGMEELAEEVRSFLRQITA